MSGGAKLVSVRGNFGGRPRRGFGGRPRPRFGGSLSRTFALGSWVRPHLLRPALATRAWRSLGASLSRLAGGAGCCGNLRLYPRLGASGAGADDEDAMGFSLRSTALSSFCVGVWEMLGAGVAVPGVGMDVPER